MAFNIPVRQNPKLQKLVNNIEADIELHQLWKCANINAVDRSGISDHGATHIRIVANAALKIFRLLVDGGVEPSITKNYGMTAEDAEVVVVTAACLHDVGISVHRDNHERYSLFIAHRKAPELLKGIYEQPEMTIMVSEILHAIIAHDAEERCFTIEASSLKVADGTDMTEGRSRIPFKAGQVNIHSVSAQAVKSVNFSKGEKLPVRISVELHNSAGIYQLDNLLRDKITNSIIGPYIEVTAAVDGENEKRLFDVYSM